MTKELWIIMAVCSLLPAAMQLLIHCMIEGSANRNGRGIDGVGAALLVGIISKFLIYGTFIGYIVLLVVWVVKVIKAGGVNPLLVAIPFIPLVVIVVILVQNHRYKKSFCAEKYIEIVRGMKDRYYRQLPDGSKALCSTDYIDCICRNYSYQNLFYKVSDEKMSEIVSQSLPVLMGDFLNEKTCKIKFVKGKVEYDFAKIANWHYDPEKQKVFVFYDDLSVKDFDLHY